MIFTKLSPKQLKSMLWWSQKDTRNYDAIVCDGSVRSGKTMSMSIGFILWSGRTFDGENFAFCGKTIDSLKRNVVTPLQKWLEGVAKLKINLSKNYMDITFNNHTNRYYMFGGKDESSYQLIQGITLAGVLFDEVALMPRSFVEQAITRTISVEKSKLWFNCNPDSSEHWFYKEWILQSNKRKALHIHFTMADNPTLTQQQIEYANSQFSGVFHDRYIKGLWVLAEGLVYSMFKDEYILHDYTPSSDALFYISCDYGILNPTSMGLWALEFDKAVRLKEYYYDGRANQPRTDEEHYQALERLADGYNIQFVIVDPSASSFIECIKRHEKFSVKKANNSVNDGISNVSTLIGNGKLFICESCKDLLRELKLYCWDSKSVEDKVIKENDHACDDMRYFVMGTCRTTLLRELSYENI